MIRSDVLIIGAGPTGLVLALWLIASTKAVPREMARNRPATISAVVSCNGLAAGIARSSVDSGSIFRHSHHAHTAPAIKRKLSVGSSLAANGRLKSATNTVSRGYMMAVAAIIPADSSGRRVLASLCRLARTTVVAVDE